MAVGVALLAGGSAEVMLELLGRLFLESGHELLDGLASDLYVAGQLSLAALWLFYGFPLADLRTFPQCSVPVRWPFARC